MAFKTRLKRIGPYLLPGLLVLMAGGVAGMHLDRSTRTDPADELGKIRDAFLLITRQYVEEVTPEDLAESAILAMLKELDPHSVYIDARNVPKVQDEYQGSFGGIGIWFEVPPDDTARVTSTFPDGPGERAGIRAGDRMIAVDGESIVGAGSLDIQNRIKGRIRTHVELTVVRPGIDESIVFSIQREKIPLYSIDSSYMLDPVTGYVRIGRFAVTTADEFRDHVSRLKARGLERLIVDLRGNPGGVKSAAVHVADEMLDGTGIIVSTRGRNPRENEIDRVTPGGIWSREPVIVLVDETSASGSEIVAGALQDHDRALIVGRRTFGKGLVQRPFQLRDGSVLQMTVARYYMPSGRLIQTPYVNGERLAYYEEKLSGFEQSVFEPQAYLEGIPDSLRFETDHGRTVFGGGGVMPDIVIVPDTTSALASELIQTMLRMSTPFFFVRDLVDQPHGPVSDWKDDRSRFLRDFRVSDSLWTAFVAYAGTKKLTVGGTRSNPENGEFSDADVRFARSTLEIILKARIAQRLFRAEAWYPVYNTIDPVMQAAQKLWTNASALSELTGSGRSSTPGVGDG